MNRKVLGLVAAIALALVGTVAIVAYVDGAEDRALAGEQVVTVLVVQDEIPAGTPADEIGDRVAPERITQKVKAEGAMTTVTSVSGKVANATLVPGEQLVARRFVAPSVYRAAAAVDVPDDLLQTTISLSPDRAVGGTLTPGSTVAVSISFQGDAVTDNADTGAAGDKFTHVTLRKVLVTNVQIDETPTEDDTESDEEENNLEPADAPTSDLLITLALDDVNTERLVWAAEHGTVWLSVEPSKAPTGSTKVVTEGNVYQ